MQDTFTIELREVYGALKAYPVCPIAQGFAAIAGTKTLTAHTLRAAMVMGFKPRVRLSVGGLHAYCGLAPEALQKIAA